MVKKNTAKKNNVATAVAVGAGIAALSAAAYVLFGKDGKKNRKAIRGWAVKMKGEIIEKFENAKELTEPVYHNIIDSVAMRYAKLKTVDKAELEATLKDIRKHWKTIAKNTKPITKKKK